jgi:2-dehydropantoate 2-reductase
MRFIVYGAGAVGSLLGGYLARAGSEVVLIGRPDHVTQVQAAGLSLKDRDGLHTIPVDALQSLSELSLRPDDIICLTLKSQDTEAATTTLRQWVPAGQPIFCFQNGVQNEEIAARSFQNVYGVLVALGVRLAGPGRIIHFSGKSLTLGGYPTGLDDRAEVVGDALSTAGFNVVLSPRTMAAKWSKLIINLSNAIYAITNLSILEVRNSPQGRDFMADVWEEGIRVLEAAGVDYDPLPGRASLRQEVEELREETGVKPLPQDPEFNYYPSTWQDLFLKRGQTEVTFLNGEIITLGKRSGVPTPLNDLLLRVVEEMAARGDPPGKYSLAQLIAMRR